MSTSWVSITLFILALLAYLHRERYAVRIQRYTIHINDLPDSFNGFTILHLSDLHSKQFGKGQKLLAKILPQKFDMVALTGDLVNKFKPDFKPAAQLIELLGDRPIFFVTGNHEWRGGFQSRPELLALGVEILDNRAVRLEKDGQHLWLLGVDDPHWGRDRLGQAVQAVDSPAPRLLLAHSPNIFPKAIKHGIELVMVGHTHGGQVRLPFLGALMAPGQGLLPKWDYGKYVSGNTVMIVNCGLGESDLPIRFNIKPEMVLLTLTNKGG